MTVKREANKLTLPSGLSFEEEAVWWDEHPDYWDDPDTIIEVSGPEPVQHTKPVNLRLPVDMVGELKVEAAKRALPYQTLIRTWLKERLTAEAEAAARRAP